MWTHSDCEWMQCNMIALGLLHVIHEFGKRPKGRSFFCVGVLLAVLTGIIIVVD